MSKLHYLAGLFDGEGYITINKFQYPNSTHTRYQLICGINMTNPAGIEVAQELFGGTIHFQERRNPNHKNLHAWVLGSQMAAKFLAKVRPHLLVKRKEAELGLVFQNHIDVTKRGHRTVIDGKRRNYPTEIMEYREGVYREMQALKH
jgi:hypothetical protein